MSWDDSQAKSCDGRDWQGNLAACASAVEKSRHLKHIVEPLVELVVLLRAVEPIWGFELVGTGGSFGRDARGTEGGAREILLTLSKQPILSLTASLAVLFRLEDETCLIFWRSAPRGGGGGGSFLCVGDACLLYTSPSPRD